MLTRPDDDPSTENTAARTEHKPVTPIPDPTLSDPARLHLLTQTGLVDASAVARLPTLDRVARLAARATRASLAQVNLITADSQVPAAAFVDTSRAGPAGGTLAESDCDVGGLWRVPVGLDASYCQHVVRGAAPLIIEDATVASLVFDNRATREGGIRAYAAAPLVTPTGAVLGSVCVVDFTRREWTESDVAALEECAALAGEEIAARLGAATLLREGERRLRDALDAERAARAEAERARARAEASRAEAEAASRSKSEFLGVMSHELRTPLNAIGGYVDLLEMGIRGPLTAQQLDDLRRIKVSQRHLLGLINEVLNYIKLETGRVRYDLKTIRVRDSLDEAEELVSPQVTAKGLRLSVHECDPSAAVVADEEKLRQILTNILSNAVKFTPTGGRIDVECEERANDVAIRIRDTGVGIPTDKLEEIFEPFVQVRASLTRIAEGTGLGLAISRDLARGLGGELTVESEVGVGSTFTLVLPRATSDE